MGTVDLVTREAVDKSWFIFAMDTLASLLTSVPAMVVYAILFILAAVYTYYMVFVLPAKQKQRRKTEKQRQDE